MEVIKQNEKDFAELCDLIVDFITRTSEGIGEVLNEDVGEEAKADLRYASLYLMYVNLLEARNTIEGLKEMLTTEEGCEDDGV